MKLKMVLYSWVFFASCILTASGAPAQTLAYRQANLASDVTARGFADNVNPSLRNSWGIAIQPGLAFFIANAGNGRVAALDPTGFGTNPGGFIIPNPAHDGLGIPTGIVADTNSLIGSGDPAHPFATTILAATADGGIYVWGINTDGSFPTEAFLKVDHSRAGAVYTGLAILAPDCCAPFLAVANFNSGLIEPYTTLFAPLAPPGSFTDPNLPAGYAPFGVQVIANQVFVTYAVQDAAKKDPVFGAGNGIVNVFDLAGNFVRRFATAGPLNAPWGVAQAGAGFGPFSNDILIGNVGDGIINAFDPSTGNFVGQLEDGDGNAIANPGLHALTFGTGTFGDPHTLYFTAGINGGQDGLFGAIATGLVSTTTVSVPPAQTDTPTRITVTVSPGSDNTGSPTGFVAVQDGNAPPVVQNLIDGAATVDAVLNGVGPHVIRARYSGDATFLPSSSQMEVLVEALATTSALTAPSNATPGSTVTLTATVRSSAGTPTGQVAFKEGNTTLGTAVLDDTGSAVLRTDPFALGVHSIIASYSGDEKFEASVSPAVTINVASEDFSISATPSAASILAGQSAQFMLTVTPTGGFADNVVFSCSQVTGITCSFSPAAVNAASSAASTTLTLTTSANVTHFGNLVLLPIAPAFLFVSVVLFGFALRRGNRLRAPRNFAIVSACTLTFIALSLGLGGCGKYGGNPAPSNRGTATVSVTAQSGTLSHTTLLTVTVQ